MANGLLGNSEEKEKKKRETPGHLVWMTENGGAVKRNYWIH